MKRGAHQRRRAGSISGGAAALVLAQLACAAQGVLPGFGQAQVAPGLGAITGRDFAGARLGVTPQQGDIRLSAARAAVWIEGGEVPGLGGTAPVQRLLLRGDVRVHLGLHSFAAARAVVWMQRLEDPAGQPGRSRQQLAVYFDRVSDPVGAAGATPAGDRLLVTGVIEGDLALRADSLARGRPEDDEFLVEGEARMRRLLVDLLTPPGSPRPPEDEPLPPVGGVRPPPGSRGVLVPGMSQPFEPSSPLAREPEFIAPPVVGLPPAERTPPIFASGGVLTIAAGEAALVADGDASAAIITPGRDTEGVVVTFSDTRQDRQLQLSATRAVIFFVPGETADLVRAGVESVRGIYLEGGVVATDGRYTLRGARAYYDVASGRAYMVEAVFWTYDQRRGLPLYVRARSLMQTAANQVRGEGVTLANSSFFQPHLSIGATSLTITREPAPAGEPASAGVTTIDGTGLTLRAGTLPFFYFPRFSGDVERFPLRDVRFENSSDSGFAVKTSWNLFGLFGHDAPPGVRVDFLLDGYFRRGVGLGAEGRYDVGPQVGNFLAYILPEDQGRDTLTSGARVNRDGDTRGVVLVDHRWSIDERWTVFLEGAYVSDENFLDALYEPLAETRRELATSAYLRRLDGNTALSILAKGNLNNFTANEYLLQSQAYTVQKLPEIDYARVADTFFGGLVKYSSDYRFSAMAFSLEEKTPAQLGFTTPLLSMGAFGLAPTDRIDSSLRAAGLFESSVLRFDTRHELSTTVDVGPVLITPFGVGRFTAYDNSFDAFSPAQDDQYRAWFGGGVRAATTVQHIDDSAESRLLDIHRIRHIIQPSVTAWAAGTNVESKDLPVYDETVEAIADGAAIKIGLDQVWQTQRGGEGRWRTVDMIRLNAEVVYSTDDTPRKSPIGRFFDYRPEYSVLGNYATIDAAWQVTDAVGLTANEVYDLDLHTSARTTVGGIIQHSTAFATFGEVHYLAPRESTFVTLGADYRLTQKWTLTTAAVYDVDATDFQELGARLNREFPSAIVSLKLRYNNITDEVALGFVVQPKFGDERLLRLRRLGRDQLDLGEVPEDAVAPGAARGGAQGEGFLP